MSSKTRIWGWTAIGRRIGLDGRAGAKLKAAIQRHSSGPLALLIHVDPQTGRAWAWQEELDAYLRETPTAAEALCGE